MPAQTFSDLLMAGLSRFAASGASANIISSAARWRIMKFVVSEQSGAAAETRFYNATTAAGTDFISIAVPANGTVVLDLAPNGTVFSELSFGQTSGSALNQVYYQEVT